MNNRTACLHTLCAGLLVWLFFCPMPGTSAQAGDEVSGYPGEIELKSNFARSETVVVLKAGGPGGAGSTQIVLLLQHEPGTPIPLHWSGGGRLLLWRTGLAILGGNGANKLFEFDLRTVRSSLEKYDFPEKYSIFGIVRYTAAGGLTEGQIRNLAEFGEVSPPSGQPSPRLPEACPGACDTGGEGATQCSISAGGVGCSASCRSGYYACCWGTQAGQPRCKCCLQP